MFVLRIVRLGALLLCGVLLCVSPAAASQSFMSTIGLAVDSGAQIVYGETTSSSIVVGKVGVPMKFHVTYSIGWNECSGTCRLVTPDVKDPEFQIFIDTDHLPAGLYFDAATGSVSGTPLVSGRWEGFSPAVRDRDRRMYHGNGFWWTQTTTFNGKTWSETKTPYAIIIDPATAGLITLSCTSPDPKDLPVTLDLNYDAGSVAINRPTLPARLKAAVASSTISWKDPSYADGSSVLDRATGMLVVSKGFGQSGQWACTKRTTANQF